MFTPTLDGALRRASTIEALHQHTQGNDALPRRAVALAGILLDEGRLYSKTINAELLTRLGGTWYETKVSRAFGDLAKHGYGKRMPGANTPGRQGFLPPLWTWYTDNISAVDISVAECLPVITSTPDDTNIAVVERLRKPYWQVMRQEVNTMDTGEIRENIYFSIYMQNLEKARASKRGRFWQVIEEVLSEVATERGVMPHQNVLTRIRAAQVQPRAELAGDELEEYCRQWVGANGGKSV